MLNLSGSYQKEMYQAMVIFLRYSKRFFLRFDIRQQRFQCAFSLNHSKTFKKDTS